MASTLDLTVSGIPDGTFMTVLDDAAGVRIQRQNETYLNEQVTIALSTTDGGITIKGYVDDGLPVSLNAAYLEGITVSSLTQRIFINNDDAAGAFYSLATPINNSGDFELEIEFSTTATSNQTLIAGNSNQRLTVDSSGFLTCSISNQNITGSTLCNDGKLHKAKVTQSGSSIELSLDGVSQGSATGSLVNVFTHIGVLQGLTQYFNGILANPIFNNNGTITSFNLGEATANVEYSNENTFGAEEVVNGDYSAAGVGNAVGRNPTATLANTSNQLVISGGGVNAFGTGSWTNLGNEGDLILIEADIISITGNVRGLDESNNQNYTSLVVGTRFSEVIVLGSGGKNFGFGGNNDANFEIILDNVTIKEVEGNFITYENQALDQRELFTLTDGVAWLGQDDLWTYGAAVSNGSEGTFFVLAGDVNGAEVQTNYSFSVSVSGLTSGQMRFRIGDDTTAVSTMVDGIFTGFGFSGAAARLDVVTGNSQPNSGATMTPSNVRKAIEIA